MKHENVHWASRVVVVMTVAMPIAWAMSQGTKEEKLKASQLPAAVTEAIKNNCDACIIDKATREVENGVRIYDIEFKNRQGEMDVSEDGVVIDRETVVATGDVPTAALEAIRKATPDGTIRQVSKDEVRAELKAGQVLKLDNPKYLYEADLVKNNQVAEIQVTPEGQVTQGPKWRKRGAKEN
jgi:hypothetical protein